MSEPASNPPPPPLPPPPRAFAQGVGTVFQVIGVLLFILSCSICCGSGLISKDAATKTNLTQIGWHFPGDAKDAPTYSAQKALTICVFAAVFCGLALATIGLGLQAENRAASTFAIVLTSFGVVFWFTHAFFAATVGGSYLLSLAAAGLGLGSAVLCGFSIAAAWEMRRNPPPPGHEILPAGYKIPYSHYHDDPPEVRLAAELEQRRQRLAVQQKELEMLEEKLKRKLEEDPPEKEIVMKYRLPIAAAILLITSAAACLFADEKSTAPDQRAQQLIDKGLAFLKTQQQPDGGWQTKSDPPGVTAIVLRAFVQDSNYTTKDDFIKKGYDKLFSYQQIDSGGIYQDLMANYNTAIAVSAISAAKDPAFKERLDRAVAFLKGLQWTERTKGPKGETVADKTNTWYGGWGYGNHARPDLSNAQFALEALHDAGLKSDDPAFINALCFLNRTQNLKATNDQPWASDDGGFVYTAANGGDSEAGMITLPDGRKVPRSYGSMTYAGLKSMIYAGVTKDDIRVKAAIGWISAHWTMDENPEMGAADPKQAKSGLYYYLYVLAHAMDAYDEPIVTDDKGVKHDWRIELIDKLTSLQKPDGSWAGEKRWMESNPALTSAYVVLALEEAQRDLREHPPQ